MLTTCSVWQAAPTQAESSTTMRPSHQCSTPVWAASAWYAPPNQTSIPSNSSWTPEKLTAGPGESHLPAACLAWSLARVRESFENSGWSSMSASGLLNSVNLIISGWENQVAETKSFAHGFMTSWRAGHWTLLSIHTPGSHLHPRASPLLSLKSVLG